MNTLKFGNGEWYGKKDTILAYNDLNSNYKPLPFNFSRASKATVVNKDGLIEEVGSGEPRIDYKDDSKGALLLEPSRSNLAIQSSIENMSGSSSNTGVVEFGNLNNGLESAEITVNGQRQWYFSTANIVSGTEYTVSFYVDSFDLSSSIRPIFYIPTEGTNGVSSIYGSQIVLGRNEKTFTATANGSQFRIGLGTSSNDTGSIKIGAVQIEEGSYPTSAIFTSGSAVTRVADSCSQTVPDGVIGQTEGVLYAELGSIPSEAIDDVFVELSDGTSNNRILFYADSNGYIRNQIKASGSISSLINTNVTVSSNMKIAITYKSNEAKVFINGVQYGGTDTSVVVPSVNKMNLENYTGARSQTSTLKDVKLYNTVLTDQELIALTQV